MPKIKDIIKFIKEKKKKYNYHWEKEGQELIQKVNQNNINKEELKKTLSILLITEDIPKDFITNFWMSCSGALELMNKNKGQYKKLVKAFDILIKNKHPFYLYMEKKIAIDVNRSFSPKYIKATPENFNQSRNILYAFTVRNVSLNYSQGLNGIVGYLLKMTNFKEEESFYLFLTLMEKILPYDYYLNGIGVEAELNIINKLLEKYEPDLLKHLNKLKCEIILFGSLGQFITSMIIFKTDPNITNILYNCFFGFTLLENNNEIFFYFYKIILAIFRTLKQDLMKCKNMEKINDVLNIENEQKKEIIQSIIYYTLFDDSKTKLDINYAKKLREEEVKKIINSKPLFTFKFKNENNIECNNNYPLCIEEYNVSSPIELKVIYEKGYDKNIKKDDNNMNNINNINNINIEEDDESILKDIIVERRKHYCYLKKIKNKYDYHWEKEGQELIQKINQKDINKEELKKTLSILLLTEANIPQDYILNFWLTCSGAREKMNENKGQYKKLVKAFNILIKNKHPFYLYMESKIAKDLNRTFNNSKNNVTEENIRQLRDILYAFTIRNVSINYSQGLNGIVGYLLRMTNFKEEESFYLFLTLMENILPYDYYLFGIGVEAEMNILNKLLELYQPEMIKYLNNLSFDSIIFITTALTKIITSLLIFQTNQNITNILFNCFFGFALLEDRNEIFFYFYKIILAIFKVLKHDLMKCEDKNKINEILKLDKEQNKETIQSIIYYILFDDSEDKLDINYIKKLREEEIKKLINNRKFKFNFQNENNIECNINYPLCVEECNNSFPIELNVIYENGYDKNEKKDDNNINNINNEENDENILKDIIIERRKHLCQNKK